MHYDMILGLLFFLICIYLMHKTLFIYIIPEQKFFSFVPFLLLIVLFFIIIISCIFFFSSQNFLRIRIIAIITEYIINKVLEACVLSKTSYRLVRYICYFYEIAYQKDKICDIYTYLTKV